MDSSSASDLSSSVLTPILVNDQDGPVGNNSTGHLSSDLILELPSGIIPLGTESVNAVQSQAGFKSSPVGSFVGEVVVGVGVGVSQDTSKKGGGSELSQEMIELMFEEECEGHRALRVLNSSQEVAQKRAQESPESSKKKPNKSNKTWDGVKGKANKLYQPSVNKNPQAYGKQGKFLWKSQSGGSKGMFWISNRIFTRTITLTDHITGSEKISTYVQAYVNDQNTFVQIRDIVQATIAPSPRSRQNWQKAHRLINQWTLKLSFSRFFKFEELKLKISAAYSIKGFRTSGSLKVSIATNKGLAVLPEDKVIGKMEALGLYIDQIFKAG
ncbi:hypothetical protein AYI68_g2604 [Smittium mucronatum]|uniref:Uncharacterized protein n=1 Tax=Smittium mucronatum TaxID=133383 RepID=A0A1R0H292_9FUNG|nr:hypothetical protein AYI68_g2604 [Smittium mucronatum]